jgi:hypothetical protein
MYAIGFDHVPRTARRRTLHAIRKAHAVDDRFFRENPSRRTYVRVVIPDENPRGRHPDGKHCVVVRKGANGHIKCFFAVASGDDLPEEFPACLDEAEASDAFDGLYQPLTIEDFDEIKKHVLRDVLARAVPHGSA